MNCKVTAIRNCDDYLGVFELLSVEGVFFLHLHNLPVGTSQELGAVDSVEQDHEQRGTFDDEEVKLARLIFVVFEG